MPRISDATVALVRERARIDEIVGETVTLRRAGSGSLKGLCPFHDEKTPSFTVRPAVGMYHCFGCGKHGGAIDFVMETQALGFVEALEYLAPRAGVTIEYDATDGTADRKAGERRRLAGAHTEAAAFFRRKLHSDEAAGARAFLTERGFDEAAWEHFAVGYSPNSWDALTSHLQRQGFRAEELVTGGLARQGQRGAYDSFRGRLMWPIRSRAGETIGFGARRLRDDDRGPKYLNTGETPLYRKGAVLYGLDLARRDIAMRHQAVIVEGYTDVMAAHLAGVTTAVATCGTAFGAEHAEVLRRVLLDQEETPGEVIFTFDGDEAGQQAALKSFALDRRFVSQTYVAVARDKLDPCDLRLQQGDTAVRDLVASRVPLFTYAIRTAIERYDLDTPDGRVAALNAAAPVVAQIRDVALRPEYARQLAGWLGMEVEVVSSAVGGQIQGSPAEPSRPRPQVETGAASRAHRVTEREALKVVLQWPQTVTECADFAALRPEMFDVADHRDVLRAMVAAGGPGAASGPAWPAAVTGSAPDDAVRSLVHALAVEPVFFDGDEESSYARVTLARVEEIAVTKELVDLKGRLQRTDPGQASYMRLFGEVLDLEKRKRALRVVTSGES